MAAPRCWTSGWAQSWRTPQSCRTARWLSGSLSPAQSARSEPVRQPALLSGSGPHHRLAGRHGGQPLAAAGQQGGCRGACLQHSQPRVSPVRQPALLSGSGLEHDASLCQQTWLGPGCNRVYSSPLHSVCHASHRRRLSSGLRTRCCPTRHALLPSMSGSGQQAQLNTHHQALCPERHTTAAGAPPTAKGRLWTGSRRTPSASASPCTLVLTSTQS